MPAIVGSICLAGRCASGVCLIRVRVEPRLTLGAVRARVRPVEQGGALVAECETRSAVGNGERLVFVARGEGAVLEPLAPTGADSDGTTARVRYQAPGAGDGTPCRVRFVAMVMPPEKRAVDAGE